MKRQKEEKRKRSRDEQERMKMSADKWADSEGARLRDAEERQRQR